MGQQMRRLGQLGWAMGLAAMVAAAGSVPTFADDVGGSANVNGGSLTYSAVDPPTVSVTLNGTDQQPTDTINIDVNDARGTGAGWNLQITSTQFSTGGGTPRTLSTTATAITAASSACDAGTCTDPTNAITYPLTVPAAGTPPAAVKLFNSAVDTGMGDFTITPTFRVTIPANTYAGTYSSTMTITAVTGP